MDQSSGKIVKCDMNFINHCDTMMLYNIQMSMIIFRTNNLGDCEVEEGEPSLANVKGDELTICTDDFESGDEFTLEVEFHSNPKPQKVQTTHKIQFQSIGLSSNV